MKVGDYIRTKYGVIAKITDILEDCSIDCDIDVYYENGLKDVMPMMEIPYNIKDEYISKSKPNILDLIEEHDILKIEEQKGVYTICEVELFKEPYTKHQFLGVRIDNKPMARRLCELNIKQILTKEQFESMGYKVK